MIIEKPKLGKPDEGEIEMQGSDTEEFVVVMKLL